MDYLALLVFNDNAPPSVPTTPPHGSPSRCELCHKTFASPQTLRTHLTSAKHRAREKTTKSPRKDTPGPSPQSKEVIRALNVFQALERANQPHKDPLLAAQAYMKAGRVLIHAHRVSEALIAFHRARNQWQIVKDQGLKGSIDGGTPETEKGWVTLAIGRITSRLGESGTITWWDYISPLITESECAELTHVNSQVRHAWIIDLARVVRTRCTAWEECERYVFPQGEWESRVPSSASASASASSATAAVSVGTRCARALEESFEGIRRMDHQVTIATICLALVAGGVHEIDGRPVEAVRVYRMTASTLHQGWIIADIYMMAFEVHKLEEDLFEALAHILSCGDVVRLRSLLLHMDREFKNTRQQILFLLAHALIDLDHSAWEEAHMRAQGLGAGDKSLISLCDTVAVLLN